MNHRHRRRRRWWPRRRRPIARLQVAIEAGQVPQSQAHRDRLIDALRRAGLAAGPYGPIAVQTALPADPHRVVLSPGWDVTIGDAWFGRSYGEDPIFIDRVDQYDTVAAYVALHLRSRTRIGAVDGS